MHVFRGRVSCMLAATAIAGAILLSGCAKTKSTAAPEPTPTTLAQDRMDIEETLRLYVRALDDSNLDAYLATLTDDARFVAEEGSYAGKAAIRNYVEPVMKSRLQKREKEGAAATATHHVVTNQAIEFIDRDNAVVRAYWMFMVAHGKGQPITSSLMGSSEDFLTRSNGKWLIKERRVAP